MHTMAKVGHTYICTKLTNLILDHPLSCAIYVQLGKMCSCIQSHVHGSWYKFSGPTVDLELILFLVDP
jgi:hypothetical protein